MPSDRMFVSKEVQELNGTLYDRVKAFLLKQNYKSTVPVLGTSEWKCVYRDHDGRKCAVGCLIADEFYGKELEGHNANETRVREALARSLDLDVIDESTMEMLMSMQHTHDHTKPEKWEECFADHRLDLEVDGILLKKGNT